MDYLGSSGKKTYRFQDEDDVGSGDVNCSYETFGRHVHIFNEKANDKLMFLSKAIEMLF